MNDTIYGALPAEWRQIASISAFEGHILEVVSAPESVIPSGTDTTKGPNRGKIPSCVSEGKAYGIQYWTTKSLGGRETLARYEAESTTDKGYWRGAYLRTGHNGVIALDCDNEAPDMAQGILNDLTSILKVKSVSVRRRPNSARWLALVKITDGPAFAKKVVISAPPVIGADGRRKPQQVECLGSGAGCVLAGTHPSGERYTWSAGVTLYSMTRAQFTEFRDLVRVRLTEGLSDDAARELIGAAFEIDWCETEKQASASRSKIPLTQAQMDALIEDDPTVRWLTEIGYPIMGRKEDGGVRLRCPDSAEHSNGNDEAVYYPVGNYRCEDTGGFKCLHAHCAGMSKAAFIRKVAELPEYKDKSKPGPECFLSRPHEIQFGDETEAARASLLNSRRVEEEIKARQITPKREEPKTEEPKTEAAGKTDKPKGTPEETQKKTGSGKPSRDELLDLKAAREDLKKYNVRKKDNDEMDEENPAYKVSRNSLYLGIQHPVLTRLDVRYDTYTGRIMVRDYNPDKVKMEATPRRPLRDTDYTTIGNNLEIRGFQAIAEEKLIKQVNLVARERTYDDLAEFVEKNVPEWDGTPRIDTMFAEHWSIIVDPEDPETGRRTGPRTPAYLAAVARYWMMALVKRAMTPEEPVKADAALVIKGPQGCGKSTALAALALRPCDMLPDLSFDLDKKEFVMMLRGHAIAEVAELSGMSRKDDATRKAWLSAEKDTVRRPYERAVDESSRRTMFGLTTNEHEFLSDRTGNRRYPIIEVGKELLIDVEWIRSNVFQLWAEARHMLKVSGGYIPQREMEILAAAVTEMYMKYDPVEPLVIQEAYRLIAQGADSVSTTEIIQGVGISGGLQQNTNCAGKVADYLEKDGWILKRMVRTDKSRTRRWYPPEGKTPMVE